MKEVGIIGLDLAKNVFKAHGAGTDGSVVFRRKLSRAQLLKFMGEQADGRRSCQGASAENFCTAARGSNCKLADNWL